MLLMSRRSLHRFVEEKLSKATLAGRSAGRIVLLVVAHLSLDNTKRSASTCTATKGSVLVSEVRRCGEWLCVDDRRYEVNRKRAERSTVRVFATRERASGEV